jgi:hypothetical protein
MHPNSLANLRPAEPGVCRNPKGRPKGRSVPAMVRKLLTEAFLTKQGAGTPELKEFAAVVVRNMKKDVRWAEFCFKFFAPITDEARNILNVQTNVAVKNETVNVTIDNSPEKIAEILALMMESKAVDFERLGFRVERIQAEVKPTN